MSRQATTRTNITEETLVDGVPEWMRPSIVAFIREWLVEESSVVVPGRTKRMADMFRINEVERYLQIRLSQGSPSQTYSHLMEYIEDDAKCLDIVQAIIATNNNTDIVVRQLNIILSTSGSKWIAVKRNHAGATLEERVGEVARDAYTTALEESNPTTQLYLKQAWTDAFGRSQNTSGAYANAIKAIEAVAWPLITPNDEKATLGTMLGEMRTNPSKWAVAINDKMANQGFMAVKDVMQNIWDGQTDRHGTANPVAPSSAAAEQAVLAAVYVCGVFSRKLLNKK